MFGLDARDRLRQNPARPPAAKSSSHCVGLGGRSSRETRFRHGKSSVGRPILIGSSPPSRPSQPTKSSPQTQPRPARAS